MLPPLANIGLMPDSSDNTAVFEAVITPHRSLGPSGLRWLIVALGALSLLVSIGLWIAGAWPVIGFTGLEVGLAVWLLLRHAAIDGESEVLLLTDAGLHVIKSRRGKRSEMRVPVGWLRSSIEERPGRTPALMLRGSGVAVEVATSLGEVEKRDLAVSLGEALARQRNPIFDNVQLRDEPSGS
ncbi:MAG: DUF2244 domain-containing protein [Pseudomonadota bacterium]|nr:DUF2244 domain-containing protein [Pseudomonadota bacterium]